eukprot:1157817-Pelagomonas_calceolata.AAC.14
MYKFRETVDLGPTKKSKQEGHEKFSSGSSGQHIAYKGHAATKLTYSILYSQVLVPAFQRLHRPPRSLGAASVAVTLFLTESLEPGI